MKEPLAIAVAGAAAADLADKIADELHLAALVEEFARRRGSHRARHAARVLRQGGFGRPAIDDSAALVELQRLIDTGAARTVNHACFMIAKRLGGYDGGAIASIARRLRRKISATAKKPRTKEFSSAPRAG